MVDTPILQFGTSRFLQAHADLFVSEALPRGEALGRITVVQTTVSSDSRKRVDAFNKLASFPVLVRGVENGVVVDRRTEVSSVARAFDINRNWDAVEDVFVREAEVIVSNTADRGYELAETDRPDGPVPKSFPAKLTKLLHARWRHGARPLDVFPCELITDNGAVLRELVVGMAGRWGLEPAFQSWLAEECRWADSLVDRIVSQALDPIGAVAEPYALWAIRAAPGLRAVCRHPAIVVTDDLQRYERLKLYIVNLGHSFLAERWLLDRRPREETVREIIADTVMRAALDALYEEEVLPVFAAIGLGAESVRYRATAMERFANPFLDHRMSDITTNHEAKKQRRFAPVIALARQYAPNLKQPRLAAGLASGASEPS